MRNVVKVCLLALSVVMLASNAVAKDTDKGAVTKKQLQRLYSDYLAEEGYKPSIDDDGDVRFKREGDVYFIAVSEKDPEFFTVVLPNIWPIESEAERAKVLAAADASNSNSKVAKAYTVKDNVWVGIEFFVARPEDFKPVFKRAMSALDNGVANFVAKMKE